ncbi:MAG: hotdog fold thioesterase [Saprospiraceae bacterium]
MHKDYIKEKMYDKDAFSQWLGIEIIHIKNDDCKLKMIVRKDMLNGFGIAHGGITYAFADSALAFVSNALGNQAVSIETSISHTKKVVVNDILTTTSYLINKSKKFAIYSIEIHNQKMTLVASFKGTVYYLD